MTGFLNKQKIVEEILKKLNEDLQMVLSSARAAHEAATHEESKPEDQYDTRGLEASYLAGAQAVRAETIEKQISFFKTTPIRPFAGTDRIEIGALVELESQKRKHLYFLMGTAGGITVQHEARSIQVISHTAPLGDELLGRRCGDGFEMEIQNTSREYQITAVE